jgi:hypothetical protein
MIPDWYCSGKDLVLLGIAIADEGMPCGKGFITI